MNYYYDIILNWNEQEAYEFYEWNDTDCLELIKKIPLFKVKHKTLVDLIKNEVKINNEFLDMIKDRTTISGKSIINKVTYASLFTDGKSAIALEFDNEGLTLNYSKLLIDDEINVIELSYNLKETLLEYEIISPLQNNYTLRQERDAKKLITLEINNLYEKNDLAKLKYLYFEYKQVTNDDIDFIYNELLSSIEQDFNDNILKLYYIIKLSYHNV